MENKIIINLKNGDKLVAEECPFEGGQIAIGIVNKEGSWIQDLVVVETFGEEMNSSYNIYVFGSEDNESYTECFGVERTHSEAI